MIRIKFSDGGKSTEILTFDGEVLEIFSSISGTKYNRIHIGHIDSMEINTDRKGKHKLVTKVAYGFFFLELSVEDDQLVSVNRLVAQVQEAKAAFRFD